MPRHFVHYHSVSVREGTDTETYIPFMSGYIKSGYWKGVNNLVCYSTLIKFLKNMTAFVIFATIY